jgi:hypothetical protein
MFEPEGLIMGLGRRTGAMHRRRPGTRTWIAAGSVVVGSIGAAVLMSAAGPGVVADGPIKTFVRSLDLSGTGTVRALPARSTKPFSMVGVTWADARTTLRGQVEVRTRSQGTGTWTGWLAMAQADEIPDPAERDQHGVRGGMSPMWTGPSDGVQVRVVASHGVAALPAGLTVDLVDPGKSRSGSAQDSSGVSLAGYAMDATEPPTATDEPTTTPSDSPSATPTDSGPPTGTPTDSPSAEPTDTAVPTGTPTAPDTGTPTATATTSPSASPTASASPSASPTPTSTPWPSQLPTLAQAYPKCASGSTPSADQTPPSPIPAATHSTIAPPPVVTRAGWGADECARESGYPLYGTAVKVVFVHHTDTTNSYTCDQSPAIVRSIYAEHLHQGWRDIGYNFLVDKCGTVFEGRFGGMSLPVVGAQTYGFNTNSMGIAAIGTYTDLSGGDSTASTFKGAAPSAAMKGAIARLAAWKLGMTGASPTGTGTLVEGASDSYGFTYNRTYTLNTISGHRNGFATDCPGNQLYSALPAIRSYAAGPVTGLAVTSITGPYGTQKSGTSYVTGTAAAVHWTASTPATLITGYDVLVDGKAVAHTTGTAATVTLTAGSHSVQVRATHITGKTSLSAAVTDIADTTRPTFPATPSVATRTGTVSSTAVPVTVTWRAADNTGIHAQAGTSPAGANLAATATSWAVTARPGASDLFAVKATDLAGNATAASVYRTPSLIQETSTTRTGAWTHRAGSSYLGGYSYSSASKGASISWTFTGRSVAWIVSRASSSGQVYVYLDGTKVSTVDLKSSTTLYRQAIWTHTWSASARHTLKIVVVGTYGRPTITTDGIAVVN